MNRSQNVILRPLRAADAAALQTFVADRLSPTSRRLRFHGTVTGCSPEFAQHLAGANRCGDVAWGAWAIEGEREVMIGEARYCVEADGATAELAIAVADAWHGRGIADRLMRALLDSARQAGVCWLYGSVLESNARMAAFMVRHGFELCVTAGSEGALRLERSVLASKPARRPNRFVCWAFERVFGFAVPAV